MLKKSLFIFIGLLTATSALAESAVTQTDLNLRTGPGVGYQPIATIPAGRTVTVVGCLYTLSRCRKIRRNAVKNLEDLIAHLDRSRTAVLRLCCEDRSDSKALGVVARGEEERVYE